MILVDLIATYPFLATAALVCGFTALGFGLSMFLAPRQTHTGQWQPGYAEIVADIAAFRQERVISSVDADGRLVICDSEGDLLAIYGPEGVRLG